MRRAFLLLILLGLALFRSAASAPTRPAATRPAGTRPAATRPASSRPSAAAARRQRRQTARKVAEMNRRLLRLFKAGKYAPCEPLLKRILRIDPENSLAWYNLACVHSRLDKPDEAIECLNTAIKHGYSAFRHMQRDPDLDPIRRTSGYKKLLSRKDEIQRRRAEKIRAKLRERFGEGYICGIDHDRKLVFATNVDEQMLSDMKRRLTAYASAQWKDLFTYRFDRYLTIVIPRATDWPYGRAVGGFYSRGEHVLYARTVGMALVHEFTHALHGADQEGWGQIHPIWITEGLATLFESSRMQGPHAVPEPNRRLNMLQRFLRRKMTVAFKDFVRYGHPQFMRRAMVAYPQGRYMMMYLYRKGLLKKWYDAYTAGYESDPSGAEAMKKVLGKDLADIEADWKKWVLAQKAPALRLPPKHAYIGIQLRTAVDGVRIVRVVPGSGADKAGLRAGDVIVEIDGQRITDAGQLMRLVEAREVGDTVRVRFRRGGKYRRVPVTLGAMPERLSAPPRTPATRPARRAPTRPASRPASRPAKKKAA